VIAGVRNEEAVRQAVQTVHAAKAMIEVGTVVFLASSASDFVAGVGIPVDDGYAVVDRIREE
jgi:hypothetical protein